MRLRLSVNQQRADLHIQLYLGAMAAPRVELQTSMGTIEVELYVNQAPKTTQNFMELAKKGYYNGTVVCWIVMARLVGQLPSSMETIFCLADSCKHKQPVCLMPQPCPIMHLNASLVRSWLSFTESFATL